MRCFWLLTLTGCSVFGRMNGEWELELEEDDDCVVVLDLQQRSGGRIEGDGEIECLLTLQYGEYAFDVYYEDDGGDVSGRSARDEVELELAFDLELEGEDWPFDVYIEAEVYGGELEGVMYLDDGLLDMAEIGDMVGEKAR